jgi:putative endonuclease
MAGMGSEGLGAAGELAAARWLRDRGYLILAAGFRARCGEIDLVAQDGATIVFAEVKTRTSALFGTPAEAVTARKRARIARAASLYLLAAGWSERLCRFDVLEVVPVGSGWRVTHLPDAFRPGD